MNKKETDSKPYPVFKYLQFYIAATYINKNTGIQNLNMHTYKSKPFL